MTTMVAVWEQEFYRIRDDETAADPGTPSWISTENQATRTTIASDSLFRVRFVCANTGNANETPVFSLYYSHEGAAYAEVGAAQIVQSADATTPTDADALTTANFQLTAGTGTALAGQYDENNAATIGLNQGLYTEIEFCLTIDSAQVAAGETIDLRVYENDTAFDVYDTNATALIDVAAGPTDIPKTPAEDDLVLAGEAPVANLTHSADPAEDDLVLAGEAPVANLTHSADPGYAELRFVAIRGLNLAAHTPTIAVTGGIAIPVDEADLVLAGEAPVANLTHSADPAEVDLVLAGEIPLAVPGGNAIIPVDEVDLVLAGEAPVANLTHSADPAEDDLVLAGEAPTLFREYNAAPAEDDLVLAGEAPVANLTHSADPAEDDLVLAGEAPTAAVATSITVPPRALYLVAQQGLWLRGSTPTIVNGQAPATPAAGSTTLTGKPILVGLTQSADPAEVDLTLAGQAPLALLGTILVPAESLALSGKVPSVLTGAIIVQAAQLNLVRQRGLQFYGSTPTAVVAAGTQLTRPPAAGLRLVIQQGLHLRGSGPIAVVTTLTKRPDPATLTLAGEAPFVLGTATPGAATPTLQGKQPVLGGSSPHIVPPAATPVLQGYYPEANPLKIPVEPAPLTFTGTVPTRPFGFVLRGKEVTLSFRYKTPPEADLALTGYAPDRLNTTKEPIVTPAGQPVLDGINPALGMGSETELSSLYLEGEAPEAIASSPVFYPAAGTLTLTGELPEVAKFRSPEAASLTLTGQAPTLRETGKIYRSPAAAALTLTGAAPIPDSPTARRRVPPAGALILTEQSVYRGRSLTVPRIAVRLFGQAPQLSSGTNWRITPTEVDLALTGQTPGVNIGPLAAPAAGGLVLTEQALDIDVTTDVQRTPPTVSLTLTPYAVGVRNTLSKQPATASLVLSTYAPSMKIKRVRKGGAKTRFISLTTRHSIEMLYS